ncbi:universal stress protein [Segetibacter koreensis]|uniref:universal stress protein n=1 Tax=Segetibacter koreensis TaxID=398037 RepID=UPI00037DB7F8|nr:universal stress protein [Segetibacter koreensis]
MEIKKILIAIDEGPTSEKVMSDGFQLGQSLKASMALLSVVDNTLVFTDGGVTPQEMIALTKNDFKERQKKLIKEICDGENIWTFVEEGKPYEVILKVADEWDADLIVLGTHGRTGASHLLVGSVAEKVIRHSPKPILVIPTR